MTLPVWLIEKDKEIVLSLHAQHGANRTSVVGLYGDKLNPNFPLGFDNNFSRIE